MKKIGIFTYMQTNYGAVLQAFALQHFLQIQGYDAEIVDFTTKEHLVDHKVFKKYPTKWWKSFLLNGLSLVWYLPLRRREKRNLQFKKDYYHFTRRYSDQEELLKDPPQKDVYISGSDQVFNLNSPYYQVYYLNFDKKGAKKIAYAPSFGISAFSEKMEATIRPLLNDFDALSCRETQGAEFISRIVGQVVPTVVDPVLLLSREEWSSVAKHNNDEYILVYDLNGGDNLICIANSIKQQMGMPVYCITGNYLKRYKVDRVILDAGPAEFVGFFENASYVVTDSFHGTSFSIIFGKPFLTYIAVKETSGRITSLLERVGLSNRIINNISEFEEKKIVMRDGTIVNLDELTRESKQFIVGAIEEK